jgi:hypothetical protein
VYDVRYTQTGMQALLASRPAPADVKQILRRIVLANYFNVPALHDVGWLYGSDAVRDLFDEQGVNFVNAESILGSANVTLASPIPGLLPPASFANTRPIREVLFSLFQIEDDVLSAFDALKKVLASTKRISTADLEKRLASFGLAIDAFDDLDNGENSIFAVMDGLIQLNTPASQARASSLTFTSIADGGQRTKVFTTGAAG